MNIKKVGNKVLITETVVRHENDPLVLWAIRTHPLWTIIKKSAKGEKVGE